MIDKRDFGLIRIVNTPRGGAPEAIRKKWVGIEMLCQWRDKNCKSAVEVETGKPAAPRAVYSVLQEDAIDALKEKCPEAAQYWNSMGYPTSGIDLFTFGVDEAEEIRPVKNKEEFFK